MSFVYSPLVAHGGVIKPLYTIANIVLKIDSTNITVVIFVLHNFRLQFDKH